MEVYTQTKLKNTIVLYFSIYWKQKMEPVCSLCQDRIPWRLSFLGADSRESPRCSEGGGGVGHLLLEIIGKLYQNLETIIVTRTFSLDWNIYLSVKEWRLFAKFLGCSRSHTFCKTINFSGWEASIIG